jgi:hypothetical protein
MVSEAVRAQFAERGVVTIRPEAGRRSLVREVEYGRKGEVEVILGGGPWGRDKTATPRAFEGQWPLLSGAPMTIAVDGSLEACVPLDLSHAPYLRDHCLDDKPVLPAAMALELMVEAAQSASPDRVITAVSDFRVLKGIVLEDEARSVRVAATPRHDRRSDGRRGIDFDVEIRGADSPTQANYRAVVHLSERSLTPPTYEPDPELAQQEFPLSVDEAYDRWLFHGSSLRCIMKIDGIGERGLAATVRPSSPERCLSSPGAKGWLIDPVVVDSGPQLVILWARARRDETPLPSSFRRYHCYGSLAGATLRCYVHMQPGSGDSNLLADVYFVDQAGLTLGYIQELECTCTKSLNRLSGHARRQTLPKHPISDGTIVRRRGKVEKGRTDPEGGRPGAGSSSVHMLRDRGPLP